MTTQNNRISYFITESHFNFFVLLTILSVLLFKMHNGLYLVLKTSSQKKRGQSNLNDMFEQ